MRFSVPIADGADRCGRVFRISPCARECVDKAVDLSASVRNLMGSGLAQVTFDEHRNTPPRADRQEALVVMRMSLAVEIAQATGVKTGKEQG